MRIMDRQTELKLRLREINDEIAHYPQPIARCDAQLGGLLEERTRLHAELEELQAKPDGKVP
jgi:chromosome segregation ATPase